MSLDMTEKIDEDGVLVSFSLYDLGKSLDLLAS